MQTANTEHIQQGLAVKKLIDTIVEKCEMMIKLYDTIVDPCITVSYRKDDVLILTMRPIDMRDNNAQVVLVKSNSNLATFIHIFKKVTGGIPIDTEAIGDPLHEYHFSFNFHDLVNTIKSCNCGAIDIPIGPFHEVSGVKLKKTKLAFEKYTMEIIAAMISLNIFVHNHNFEIDTIEDVEEGTFEIVIKDNIKNIKIKLTYRITSLEYNFELTADNTIKLSELVATPIHTAYENIHEFVTEMLKAEQTKEEIYRIINVIASKDIKEFAKVLTGIDMSTFSGILK